MVKTEFLQLGSESAARQGNGPLHPPPPTLWTKEPSGRKEREIVPGAQRCPMAMLRSSRH